MGRFEFRWCYLCSSDFSPLSLHPCVSFWAGFQETFPLAACCVFRLHPDMPQHVQRKSPCLQINLHKQNELCHHPPLWELFSGSHTLSLSYLKLRVSLKKSQIDIFASFSYMQNSEFDNFEAPFKMDTHIPPKYLYFTSCVVSSYW